MKSAPRKKSVAPASQAFLEALEGSGQAALVAEVASAAPAAAAYAWDEAPAPVLERARAEADDEDEAYHTLADMPPPPGYGGGGPSLEPVPSGAPMPMRARRLGGPPPAPEAQKRRSSSPAPAQQVNDMSSYAAKTSEELQLEATGLRVVETGFWIWRNVIVPPNVYVVHTRRGRPDPVTLGLGKSFRFNPVTDSYLAVPAAMQTIGIFARCISAEKQGIHVLAYVQWLISDFALAYKRLDFSNEGDPTGIVNSQLREQAEAAIKDTVSTMTVEQVLTDKAPIIQELTERMKSVAEGRDGDGLGLKIVTVQIKEAVVVSASLFENLQAPYRHEKARVARLSSIASEAEVQAKAREAEIEREAADARASSEIARLRAQTELASTEATLAARTRQEELTQRAEQAERGFRHETELTGLEANRETAARRHQTELESLQAEFAHAARQAALSAESELAALRVERQREAEALRLETENEQEAIALREQLTLARTTSEAAELTARERLDEARRQAELNARIALDRIRHEAKLLAEREGEEQRYALLKASQDVAHAAAVGQAEVERLRQETANGKTAAALQAELVHTLPALAAHMPDIQEYRYVGVADGGKDGGPFNALPEFLARSLGIAQAFGWKFGAGAPAPAADTDTENRPS